MEIDDIVEVAILDISTAHLGEYSRVTILKIEGKDFFITDGFGNYAWVTEHHLELVDH